MIIIDFITVLKNQINFCRKENNYTCGIIVKNEHQKNIVFKIFEKMQNINWCYYNNVYKFTNGSRIRIIVANQAFLAGIRFNGVIIDDFINKEIISTSIIPNITPLFNEDYNSSLNRVYLCKISLTNIIEAGKTNFMDGMDAMSFAPLINNKEWKQINNFKEKYKMFNDCDIPLMEKDLNGEKIIVYTAYGIPKEVISDSIEFINRTQETYLKIVGEYKIPKIDWTNKLNIHLLIDTNVYDGYEIEIKDGLAIITLHEIVNEKPVFKKYKE